MVMMGLVRVLARQLHIAVVLRGRSFVMALRGGTLCRCGTRLFEVVGVNFLLRLDW